MRPAQFTPSSMTSSNTSSTTPFVRSRATSFVTMRLGLWVLALTSAFVPWTEAHATLPLAPSTLTIASNIAKGDVSHCAHYRTASHDASEDVKATIEVGIHLCENFGLRANPKLSSEGRAWLAETTHCLMNDMDRAFSDPKTTRGDAASLLNFTASSHVACYVDHGFCALSFSDKTALLSVIDIETMQGTPRLAPAWRAVSEAAQTLVSSCAQ